MLFFCIFFAFFFAFFAFFLHSFCFWICFFGCFFDLHFFTFFEEKTIPLFYRIWLEAVTIRLRMLKSMMTTAGRRFWPSCRHGKIMCLCRTSTVERSGCPRLLASSIARGIWMQDQDALDCQILKRWCQFGELILLMQKQFSTLAPTLQFWHFLTPKKPGNP